MALAYFLWWILQGLLFITIAGLFLALAYFIRSWKWLGIYILVMTPLAATGFYYLAVRQSHNVNCDRHTMINLPNLMLPDCEETPIVDILPTFIYAAGLAFIIGSVGKAAIFYLRKISENHREAGQSGRMRK